MTKPLYKFRATYQKSDILSSRHHVTFKTASAKKAITIAIEDRPKNYWLQALAIEVDNTWIQLHLERLRDYYNA